MDQKTFLSLPLLAASLTLATPAHAATVDLGWAIDLAAPYVETAFVALAATLVGWLISRLGRWVGLEIERDHAEALHGAIARGVRHAVSLVRREVKDHASVDVESRLIAETAIYLEKLMPDALNHFGLTDDALDRLIRAYLGPDELHWSEMAPTPRSMAPTSR
ncbi:MAG: hypothetical protein RIC24_00470 [Hyphomicrobiales bacterium]|jgi:hypothetical protein